MIINNTSVPGIYLYTAGIELEKGDFVIYGNSLFICDPKQGSTYLTEETFDESNFKSYIGGEKITWEEFEELYKSSGSMTNDKLVVSPVLSKIIKKLIFGIDFSGVINEEIISSLSYVSPGIKEFVGNSVTPATALDKLIQDTKHDELNNLCIKVSRDLFKNILPDVSNLKDIAGVSDSAFNSVILKHYTYTETTGSGKEYITRVRVQEVIDHINGVCLYRYIKLLNSNPGTVVNSSGENGIGKVSSWKISSTNLNYLNKMDSLLKYITDKEEELRKVKFNFKSISIPDYVQEEGNKKKYTLTDTNGFDLATITITSKNGEGIMKSYSMTVNLLSPEGCVYEFINGVKIYIDRQSSDTNPALILENPDGVGDVNIISIYTRNYE